MKFITNLLNFQKLINKVNMVLPQKSTIPVLEHIYLSLEGNTLKAISSDKDITLMSWIDVEGEMDGKILIPGKKITDIIKSYSGALVVTFEADLENFDVIITIGQGTFKFKGLDPDDYLSIPELFDEEKPDFSTIDSEKTMVEGGKYFSMNKESLVRLCAKTSIATSDDEYRPSMTGVLFQFRENYINAVSTDSYRLVKAVAQLDKPSRINDIDVIIPGKSIDFLKKLDDDDVVLSFVDNGNKISHLRFDFGSTIFVTKLIEEKFPPYELVIPTNNSLELVVDKNQFMHKLKPLGTMANKKVSQIRMVINSDNLVMTFNDDESQTTGKEVLSCEFNSENFEVAFNIKFIEEAVNNITDNETTDNLIRITFSEPNKPALVLPIKDNSDLLMLVMPVRLNS